MFLGWVPAMRRAWIAFGICTACAGKAPHDTTDAGGSGDGGVDTSQSISGRAMDYFAGVALQSTTITSDGIDPAVMTTSASDASYSVSVPVGSKLFLLASRASYRETRNVPLTMNDTAVTQDIYLMSTADVTRQYTSVGKAPTASKGFLA